MGACRTRGAPEAVLEYWLFRAGTQLPFRGSLYTRSRPSTKLIRGSSYTRNRAPTKLIPGSSYTRSRAPTKLIPGSSYTPLTKLIPGSATRVRSRRHKRTVKETRKVLTSGEGLE